MPIIYRRGEVNLVNNDEIGNRPAKAAELLEKKYEAFIDDLCAHIRIVGGLGDPEVFSKMPLEEVFKHLYPNNIILGFRNIRLKEKYQLSYLMRVGEDFFDEIES